VGLKEGDLDLWKLALHWLQTNPRGVEGKMTRVTRVTVTVVTDEPSWG